MNKLLAKLPRSSSGSRDASASSSASRWPFDIFEVSINGAAVFRVGSAVPVSALTCSGGASSGVFIECCPVLCVLLQDGRRAELCIVLCQALHLLAYFPNSEVLREPQRTAAEWGETCAQDHSVVRILR